MLTIGSQQDDDTLKRVEQQINTLSAQLQRGRRTHPFPQPLEREYLNARNRRFLEIDRRIIAGGLLFYLAFSWSDFMLGGDNASLIAGTRLLLTLFLFGLLWWVPRSSLAPYMMAVAAGGVFLAGASVIAFISLIPGEMRFTYHLGMIPIQVFAMVALRLSVRAMLSVSVALFLLYVLMLLCTPQTTGNEEINRLVLVFIPLFMVFWLLLVVMGGYLAFAVEAAARNDYVQNRLLSLEALRLQILTRQLHQLSTTDSLTGIANRRYFEQQLESEWRRAQRQQHSLALIMLDVDRFKDYNDGYGHQQGDYCLQQIAQVMAAQCQRPGDVCARYGGEEFVVLLPVTDAADAARVAEKIRTAVLELAIVHSGSEHRICTVSAGVAAITPSVQDHSDELLRRADRCLYQAKDQGRNRVVSGG